MKALNYARNVTILPESKEIVGHFGKPVPAVVPDLTTMDVATATSTLVALNLKLAKVYGSIGLIINQSPPPAADVMETSDVIAILAQTTVPDVAGMTVRDAIKALNQADLYDDGSATNMSAIVASQLPVATAVVTTFSPVTLTVV